MLRRSAIAAVGGYDERLSFEDVDMWLRLSFRFQFVYLPGLLVRHRKLETSLSRSHQGKTLMFRSQTQILQKWLNAGLDEETQVLVMDGLLRNGARQLVVHDAAGARETFDVVVRKDARLHRRLLALAGMLPGGCTIARALATVGRGYLAFASKRKLHKVSASARSSSSQGAG
jgi:hypothetical protein